MKGLAVVVTVFLWLMVITVPPVMSEDELIWNAVDRVLKEGLVANDRLRLQGIRVNHAFAYAIAAMNYTMGMVSTPHYAYLARQGYTGTSDPEEILQAQAGLCQSVQIVFMAIAERIGLPSRAVAVWYPEAYPEYKGVGVPGHATVEVYYGTSWHWFDPTSGSFYRRPNGKTDEVLSLLEVLALSHEERAQYKQRYTTLLWEQVNDAVGYTIDGFLDYDHLTVESPYGHVLYQR